MAWLVALVAYAVYAVLYISSTGLATKTWCATAFTVVSVGAWLVLHHFDRKRRRR